MNDPKIVAESNRLKTVASLFVALIDAYKNVINSDEPEACKFRQHAFDGSAKVMRDLNRLQRNITKMSADKGVPPKSKNVVNGL